MFNLGAIAKTEHYEIAVYGGLVDKAGMLGQKQVGHLLHQTLQEEETMAQKVEEIGRRVGSDLIQPQKKAA